jgi:hypothetical protein
MINSTGKRSPLGSFRDSQRRQLVYDPNIFEANGYDLTDQTQNIFFVVVPIRIVRDAAALVGRDLILIDDPFKS